MSNAVTSSAALIDLENDLTQLSKALHVIYDLMNADMRQVGEAWQDSKYQEFVQGYQPKIQKCEEIANRYTEWCAKVLEPTIQNVVAVETTAVSGGAASGRSVGGAVIGGAAVAGTVVGGVGIAEGFNLGTNNASKPSTKAVPISNGCGSENSWGSRNGAKYVGRPIDALLTGTSIEAQNASCDQHDKDYYNGVPKEKADADFRYGKNRSPLMGAVVEGDIGGAVSTVAGEEVGSKVSNLEWISRKNQEIKETANESYLNAQRDRELSQRFQPIWEEEHQQSLDAENYRVDIEEGGFSKI